MDKHTTLVNKFLEILRLDQSNKAIGVIGSVARGDYDSKSDIDLIVVTMIEPSSNFIEQEEDGIVVETKFGTFDSYVAKLHEKPINVYQFFELKPLYDPEKLFPKLKRLSEEILQNYVPEDSDKLKKWLRSVELKVGSAVFKQDDLILGFILANAVWKVVEGLYMVNSMPTPSSTSAFKLLPGLKKLPEDFQKLWNKFLLGNLVERTDSLSKLINFVILS